MSRLYKAANEERDRQEQELTRKIDELMEAEQFEKALVVERQLMDEYHRNHYINKILQRVRPNVEQLRAEDSGSSWCLLGLMYWWGEGGVQENEERAFRCYERAGQEGHGLALYCKADSLYMGRGAARDKDAGYVCFITSAKAGCRLAMHSAGYAYELGLGVPQSYLQAAIWFSRDPYEPASLSRLLNSHPMECCPFGVWTPDLHFLVPPVVASSMIKALLVCKRLGVLRPLALMIAQYVCTK